MEKDTTPNKVLVLFSWLIDQNDWIAANYPRWPVERDGVWAKIVMPSRELWMVVCPAVEMVERRLAGHVFDEMIVGSPDIGKEDPIRHAAVTFVQQK